MTIENMNIWLAFVVVGIATTLPRSIFFVIPKKYHPTQHFYAVLKFAPLSALVAIIVPDVLSNGSVLDMLNPKIFVSIATIFCLLVSKNAWLPFVVGMLSLILFKKII